MMKNYEVRYSIDGKGSYVIYVQATNTATARQVALGQIGGMAGYIGKRISVQSVREVR